MFVDGDGNEWQAFDVVPRDNERRRYDRRSTAGDGVDDERRSSAGDGVDDEGRSSAVDDADDERREGDRRLSVGRTLLRARSGDGWLCFDSGTERRRLRPIPEDWTRCNEGALVDYCRAAEPVRAPRAADNKNAAVNPRR
jgi:hypothetical protein